jgi:hypothetical protein
VKTFLFPYLYASLRVLGYPADRLVQGQRIRHGYQFRLQFLSVKIVRKNRRLEDKNGERLQRMATDECIVIE